MPGSLAHGGGENIPGIAGACATRKFTYLLRAPCTFETSSHESTAASLKMLAQGVRGSFVQSFPPSLTPGWVQTSYGSSPVPAVILNAGFHIGTEYKEKEC